jgi:DNA-binding transcriptional LysR family regulator
MRSLNLDQLRTLVEVVSQGNFSAAGRQLNLTQPAVSLHVRELERRFGVRLVERVGRRAYPTAPGRDLADYARRIFNDCENVDSMMRRYRESWLGQVRIGTGLSALIYVLPPRLQKIRAEYPGIDLLVTFSSTMDSIDSVMRNVLDLALVMLPIKEPRLRITPLRAGKLVAILPADTIAIPKVVTPDYAARQSLVLEHPRGAVQALIMRWLSGQMPLAKHPTLLGTVEAMKAVVSLGLGMSIVPDVAVAEPIPNVVVRPLKPPISCSLALIERRDKSNDQALNIVRDALVELDSRAGSHLV